MDISPLGWATAGVVLCVLELLTAGFGLLFIGLAALVVAGLAWAIPGLSMTVQVLVFAVLGTAGVVAARTVFRSWFAPPDRIATNTSRLVGMEAQVIEPIPGHGRKGAAKVDGEVWSAEMEDHGPANAGEVLHIARADGATLTLRRDSSAERGQTRGQP